jgi:hypothetical protein
MARQIITYSPGHDLRRQLIACDPSGLKALSVSVQRNQGVLEAGSFITLDGQRALVASQVEGVLAALLTQTPFPIRPKNSAARSQFIRAEDFSGRLCEG